MKLIKTNSSPLAQLRAARRRQVRKALEEFLASGEQTMKIVVEVGDMLTGCELYDSLIEVLTQDQLQGSDAYAGVGVHYVECTDEIYLYRNPNL